MPKSFLLTRARCAVPRLRIDPYTDGWQTSPARWQVFPDKAAGFLRADGWFAPIFTAKVRAEQDIILSEPEIDAILLGQSVQTTPEVIKLTERLAQEFISDLLSALRERQLELRSGQIVFVGGGSILLRRHGRRKARFLTDAILYYSQGQGAQAGAGAPVDDIVKRCVAAVLQSLGGEAPQQTTQVGPAAQEVSEPVTSGQQWNSEDLSVIAGALSAFQRKRQLRRRIEASPIL